MPVDLDVAWGYPLKFAVDLDAPFFYGQRDRGVRQTPWRHSFWQSLCEGRLADPAATLLLVVSIPLCEQLPAQVLVALMQEV